MVGGSLWVCGGESDLEEKMERKLGLQWRKPKGEKQ